MPKIKNLSMEVRDRYRERGERKKLEVYKYYFCNNINPLVPGVQNIKIHQFFSVFNSRNNGLKDDIIF